MSASVILPRTQIAVLIVLLVLTAMTVAISFLNIPGRWHFSVGIAIAVLKATLVVLFFMHVDS